LGLMARVLAAVALGLKGTGLKVSSVALVTVNLFHTLIGNLQFFNWALAAGSNRLGAGLGADDAAYVAQAKTIGSSGFI
jgi:hypothetical protein